jgi:hypothetical protein
MNEKPFNLQTERQTHLNYRYLLGTVKTLGIMALGSGLTYLTGRFAPGVASQEAISFVGMLLVTPTISCLVCREEADKVDALRREYNQA